MFKQLFYISSIELTYLDVECVCETSQSAVITWGQQYGFIVSTSQLLTIEADPEKGFWGGTWVYSGRGGGLYVWKYGFIS